MDPPTPSLLYISIFYFTIIATQTLSLDPKFKACEPKSCGRGPEISYPFYLSGKQESFCGYPSFELTCDDEQKLPVLGISGEEYLIKNISYFTQSFQVMNSKASHDDPCPSPLHNLTLDRTPFFVNPSHINFSILYNCSDHLLKDFTTYPLTCPGNTSLLRSFGVFDRENLEKEKKIASLSCQKLVDVPILAGDESDVMGVTYVEILKRGFVLNWAANSCSRCISSGGRCGTDKQEFVCFCTDGPKIRDTCKNGGISWRLKNAIGIMIACGFLVATLIAGGLLCFISRRRKTSDDLRQQNLKALIPLKHYTYAQVKRITKSFAEVVGKGGFGTVYRGTLADGRSVAVKVLKESKGNGEDFMNEVASMSKTSHVNIVNLLGFCSEGSKRAIIYEFLENGSLEKFISNKTSKDIDWTTLYSIACGVARGLEYLHHGCKTRIVHFDIKPHNVLLDNNICPKVSDFGLAKLCEKKETILSLLDTRGTIGYIAPELFSRMYGRVSHKSDVYSYGMLVLEMIGARNKTSTEDSASDPSSMYFPEWIYKDLENRDNGRLIENGINSEEEEIARKMTLVGLWCIQPSPSDRPSMDRVVEMMEGNVNAIEVPPRPVFQIPAAPLQESSTISEDISAYTEVCSINFAERKRSLEPIKEQCDQNIYSSLQISLA